MSDFKPMLSGKVVDTAKLQYPGLASPKLDGIRAIVRGGVVLSRNLKPIPNKHVQKLFGRHELNGLDGELIFGDPTAKDCYSATNSAVMSIDGEPDVQFFVFDCFKNPDDPYYKRIDDMVQDYADELRDHPGIVLLTQSVVNHELHLLELEEKWLNQGFEGLMYRDGQARYKFGRSTDKEGILLKLKRFADSEARIIGFEVLMSNQNEATKDALGHTERSTNKEGLVPMDTLGAIVVQDIHTGVEFNIGTGFSQEDRRYFWAHQDSLMGRIVKYKSFAIGVKDKPRFPVFLGFRAEEDL